MRRIAIGLAVGLFAIAVPLTAMAGREHQGTSVNGGQVQGTSVNGIIVGNGRATGAEGATGLKVEGVRVEGGRLVR